MTSTSRTRALVLCGALALLCAVAGPAAADPACATSSTGPLPQAPLLQEPTPAAYCAATCSSDADCELYCPNTPNVYCNVTWGICASDDGGGGGCGPVCAATCFTDADCALFCSGSCTYECGADNLCRPI